MTRGFVVDASVALAWVLPDERNIEALMLRERVERNQNLSLFVPQIFWYEVSNILWVATVRRNRLTTDLALKAIHTLQDFQFESYYVNPERCLCLALDKNLTVYDSTYLVLAQVFEVPLWTFDNQLASAARDCNIRVEPV